MKNYKSEILMNPSSNAFGLLIVALTHAICTCTIFSSIHVVIISKTAKILVLLFYINNIYLKEGTNEQTPGGRMENRNGWNMDRRKVRTSQGRTDKRTDGTNEWKNKWNTDGRKERRNDGQTVRYYLICSFRSLEEKKKEKNGGWMEKTEDEPMIG